MNKYGARKTQVNGIMFDSMAEARRYGQLLILQKAGHVSGLTLQVPFILADSVILDGRKKPALRYIADFVYCDIKLGQIVVEDVKGVRTPLFRVKQHLMKSVHGIDVRLSS